MILNNIKSNQKERNGGFTIVELLVVIVVIGILAAITIVSYTGITARAKTSTAQSNAQSVQNIAEVRKTDPDTGFGAYPALTTQITGYSNLAHLPSGILVIPDAATTTITATNGQTTVGLSCKPACASAQTGGRVTYWDFTNNIVKYVYYGDGASADTFYYPAS